MKQIATAARITFGFLVIFFGPASYSYSSECKNIEYAELQQMNNDELISKYCDYKTTFEFSIKESLSAFKAADEMRAIGNHHGILHLMEKNKYNLKVGTDCVHEIGRLERILKKRKIKRPKWSESNTGQIQCR